MQRNLSEMELIVTYNVTYLKFYWKTQTCRITFGDYFFRITPDSSLIKNKPNICPPQSRKSTFESALKFLQEQSFYEENFKVQSNISEHEWQDILIVKKNKDIIIKDTDKGGAILIMNTKYYLKMISNHLNGKAI